MVNSLELGHFHSHSSCTSGPLKVTEQKNWLSIAAAQGSCVRTAPGWKNSEKSVEFVPFPVLLMLFIILCSLPLQPSNVTKKGTSLLDPVP